MRDSKDQNGPTLIFAMDEWRGFVEGVKAGKPLACATAGPTHHRPVADPSEGIQRGDFGSRSQGRIGADTQEPFACVRELN